MARLNRRREHVLVANFGLDDEAPATLEQIACDLGISRARVWQVRASAIRRLRTSMSTSDKSSAFGDGFARTLALAASRKLEAPIGSDESD